MWRECALWWVETNRYHWQRMRTSMCPTTSIGKRKYYGKCACKKSMHHKEFACQRECMCWWAWSKKIETM